MKNSEEACDYIAKHFLGQASKADSQSQSNESSLTVDNVGSKENIATATNDWSAEKKVSDWLTPNKAPAKAVVAKLDLPNSEDKEFDKNIFSLIDSLSGTKLSINNRKIDEVSYSQSDNSDNNTNSTNVKFFKLSSLQPSCESLKSFVAKSSSSSNEGKQLSLKSNQINGSSNDVANKSTSNKNEAALSGATSSNNEKRK